MRLIHGVPFTQQEIESYRQLVFNNITDGLRVLIEALPDMDFAVSEDRLPILGMLEHPPDMCDREPFPLTYLEPLKSLWTDSGVQAGWGRGNVAAVPEKCVFRHIIQSSRSHLHSIYGRIYSLSYFYADLVRLFDPAYQPTPQDIVLRRGRTTGITETVVHMKNHKMLMIDVGEQRSELRKWIHCFSEVPCVVFLVSLSGYDQCLAEDKHIVRRRFNLGFSSPCASQCYANVAL